MALTLVFSVVMNKHKGLQATASKCQVSKLILEPALL